MDNIPTTTGLVAFYEKGRALAKEDTPTANSLIRAMGDHSASEFIIKMAALNANVSFRFNKSGDVCVDTQLGRYTFIFNSDMSEIVVEQVM